jgi:hypothetical protein
MSVDFVTEIAASNPRFRRSTRVLPMIFAEEEFTSEGPVQSSI